MFVFETCKCDETTVCGASVTVETWTRVSVSQRVSRVTRSAWQSLPAPVAVSVFALVFTALVFGVVIAFAVTVPLPANALGILACAGVAIPVAVATLFASQRAASWLESDIPR